MFEPNSDIQTNPLNLNLELMKFSNPREALGAICFLAAMDNRYINAQFNRIVNRFYTSVAHGKLIAFSNPLTVQGKTIDHPFILATWVSVNDITAAILDNKIRDCYSGEANAGDNHFVTSIVSPFIKLTPESEYYQLVVGKIKEITGSDKLFFLD